LQKFLLKFLSCIADLLIQLVIQCLGGL